MGTLKELADSMLAERKGKQMRQGFTSNHFRDENGNPTGGATFGTGFAISWQRGPLGRIGTSGRVEPNGAFVEDIIAAARDRIEFYQQNGKECDENAQAIMHLQRALDVLNQRTHRRTAAGQEGTHEGK